MHARDDWRRDGHVHPRRARHELSALITTYLGQEPRIVRVLVGASVQVGLLNYVLMPRLTRLLAAWLYAEPGPLPRPGVS